MTSRAVQYRRYGSSEVLETVEREDPRPGSGEVRVAVRAAGVNPIDWKLRSGAMATGDAPDGPTGTGQDLAGVVAELGPDVDAFALGDEVLGRATGGSYAEQARARVDDLVPKPAELSFEQAASLPIPASTADRILDLVGLGPGVHPQATLLVDGASGAVGVFVVQLARARGVTVLGTASEARQDEVRALGATPLVYGSGLADRVRAALPAGGRVDAALDLAGKGGLADLVALVGAPERVVTIADGDAAAHGVRFSAGGGDDATALIDAAAMAADGTLRLPAITTYPLEQAARAQDDNESARVPGKLVIVP